MMQLRLTAQITPEDMEIAEALATAYLPSAGWRQNVGKAVSVLAQLLSMALILLLTISFILGIPEPRHALRLMMYVLLTSSLTAYVHGYLQMEVRRRQRFGLGDQSMDFEILDESFAVTTAYARHEFLWGGVQQVRHDGKHIYVIHRPSGVTAIPARCFTTYAEFEQFFGELLKRVSVSDPKSIEPPLT